MSYGYNLDGSLKTVTYPSGATVTYAVDSAGRDVSAVDSGNGINYATAASYDAASDLTGFVSGNSGSFAGITNSFSFNKRLQPVNMSASAPSQTVFSLGYDFHFANGDNGNVFGITNYKDNSRNQSFTYDSLNRLTSAQNAGTNCAAGTVNGKSEYWGNTYAYDAWGNLTDKTKTKCNAEDIHFTADAHNWLHVLAGADYAYDAAGNMTYNANGAQSYSYDQENRITGAAGYTYTYDGDGNRVVKSNGSTGTLYWYMSPGIVAESDLGGNLNSEYVFFLGERVARKDFPGLAVSYYFSDHLKTTDIVTDASGNIKNESDFYPWGGELEFLANDSNHYKFTGKERDSETGLDYFGARYYSNGLGRFITPDWAATPAGIPYAVIADPQSLNLYSYVRNIPTTRFDPDGHFDDPFGVLGSGLMTQRQIHERNLARLQAIDVATSCQMAMDQGCASGQGSNSGDPQPLYPINRWIYRTDQKIDKALARWYEALENVLQWASPAPKCSSSLNCPMIGIVFPIGNMGALPTSLRIESALSVFTEEGTLTQEVIANSKQIIAPSDIHNPSVPAGFGKYSTQTFQSPAGDFQVHFYRNPTTGEVYYGLDYKVIFNAQTPLFYK